MLNVKRLLVLFLTLIMLTCAACNKSGDNSTSQSDSQISSETTDSESTSSTDSESSPQDSQTQSGSSAQKPVDKTPFECETERLYSIPELQGVESAFSENIFALGDGYAIVAGDKRLAVSSDGLRIDSIVNLEKTAAGDNDSLLAKSSPAVEVRVTTDKSYVATTTAAANYTEFYSANGDLYAVAEPSTENGSQFAVYDRFYVINGGFGVERTVKVQTVGENAGYSSVFEMQLNGEGKNEYFAPSRVYGECQAINSGNDYLASESRLPTPVTAIRNKQTGLTLAINDPDPSISTKKNDALNGAAVSSDYLYGALGFNENSVMRAYPCIEFSQGGDTRKYAALNTKNDIRCNFVIRVFKTEDFNDAMSQSLGAAVEDMKKIEYTADLDKVYSTSIEDMSSLVVYRDTAYVLPFAVYVTTGNAMAYVAQCGYIGMQISCGYELLRYGISTGNEEIYQNGFNIVNMWATTAIPEGSDSGIFCCYNNGKGYGGTAPTLRQLSDGAEGMLDALRLMESNRPKVNVDAWWNLVYGYAEFLVNNQNDDGSWYRAYDYDGNMLTEDNDWGIAYDDNSLADQKYSTQIPIRFLTRMYEYTEDERYLEAAIKAGNYVKTDVIDILEYRGGTLDQKGNYEREAGIYAFYAMSALYGATGDTEWLKYAEKTGAYAMSFVYTHDFVVQNRTNNPAGVPLTTGCTAGFSPIVRRETGVIGVDVFSGYLYYEFFKMYLWTGKDCYLDQALILQNCQKRTMDINGEYGFSKKSFMCEATGIMNFSFSTAENGVWLPWITNSVIEPMTYMLETFDCYSIEQLMEDYSVSDLADMLKDYGNGGYEYGIV